MRRRLLPFKLLCRSPQSPLSRSSLVDHRGRSSSHLLHSSSPKPRLVPDSFRSWQPGGVRGVCSGSLGFLASRILSAAAAAAGARFSAGRLLESGSGWLKVSLQRKPFGGGRRVFGSPRSFWKYMMPTSNGVVLGLIGANVAVFILWKIADHTFMRQNFMISLDNFKSGRLHTLVTSAFSHSALDHLATNMIGLYFFGTSIGRVFGPEFLLKLYIGGAVGGSIFFLIHKALIASSSEDMRQLLYSRVPGLGASAAVNAIILLDVFLFPKNIYYVNFFIPVPAILMGAFIVGSDLWRVKKGEGEISGSAHLGGACVAALVWARIKKRWI